MLRRPLLAILCHALWASSSVSAETGEQVPLTRPLTQDNATSRPRWPLNFTSTAPHIFSSASSLLQQWGNTFFPNGHAIVACEIAPYTLFYHGRQDDEMPPSPEWLAFDLGMAYGIMGSFPDSHILTYQTTRTTKAVYFDGESATLMGLGQLDTQMLQIYGNISGPSLGNGFRGLGEEYARAHGLCDWLLKSGLRGPGWGFEGVIRMNAAFEMIWCDFTSPSLRLLSQVNITAPLLPSEEEEKGSFKGDPGEGEDQRKILKSRLKAEEPSDPDPPPYYTLPPQPTRTDSSSDPTKPAPPPNWRHSDREPFLAAQSWAWFDSAAAHYGGSVAGGFGETRAKVLPCGILSYYSPRFGHLSTWRAEEERHRLNLTEKGFWEGSVNRSERGMQEEDRRRALQDLTRRKRLHHLANTTAEEAAMMRGDAERTLKRYVGSGSSSSEAAPEEMCSGADWVVMTNEIKQSTTTQLKETMLLLSIFPSNHSDRKPAITTNTATNTTALRTWLSSLRSLNHLFMVSYLEYPKASFSSSSSSSSNENPSTTWSIHSDLYAQTYSRCRYRYTRLMEPSSSSGTDPFNPEEQDLRWSVEETFGAICSVLLTIGFGIEQAWATHFQHQHPFTFTRSRSASGIEVDEDLRTLAAFWADGLDELVAWLGWADEFAGCKEVCAWDERCYIPIWPFIRMGGPGRGGRGGPPGGMPHPPPGRSPHHGGDRPSDGPPRGPGGDGPPDGGRGRGPPSRSGRGPSWGWDESDLWEPKCIKASYFVRG
ncbi:hypothetical protein F5Y16DRAFT_408094 [Xylariaceae sp. FL0255]|nr:hypothetical protein F5Y16DRAFT_408094 [Xylariaceae sp. FL0255]